MMYEIQRPLHLLDIEGECFRIHFIKLYDILKGLIAVRETETEEENSQTTYLQFESSNVDAKT